MKEIGKSLSPRAIIYKEQIEASLRKPIQYHLASERPNKSDRVFGCVDTNPSSDKYDVYLANDLSQEYLDSNLLHELHHIVQAEANYPSVYNKNTPDFHSDDRAFIQEVGSHLASSILDIDVNDWLESNGFSFRFFLDANFNAAMEGSSRNYTALADPLNFANLFCGLFMIAYYVNPERCAQLYSAYSRYPKVIEAVKEAKERIRSIGVDSPLNATFALCFLVDYLNLWKYYYIACSSFQIKTHNDYLRFVDKVKAQTKTKI